MPAVSLPSCVSLGPALPTELCFPGSVQYGSTVALVGGACPQLSDTIYLFNPDEMTWTVLDERLSEARSEATAILVDESIFPEC